MTDSDTYQAALAYAARGWSLVALHWITAAGQCSCGRPGCKSAGKHPINGAWQTRSEEVHRWAPGHAGELENIGIRTGTPSGFWVLDFDPADADDAGRELEHLIWKAGLHPHVRTGGGGWHWRFELPDFEVRNRQSAGGGRGRTHGLPRGWDVRGEGGQVVAPPSVSAKGAYVELGEPPAGWCPYAPPTWLLEMIRPPERGDPPSHTVPSAWSPLLPGPTGSGDQAGGGFAGTGFGESSHSADRIQAYCTAALIAECEEYASLTDGRRGEAAAAFGRRLVELANLARWPLDAVQDHFSRAMDAAAANGGGGGYASHEVVGQWARAVEHVGGRAAVMPPGLDILPGFPSPFPSVGVAGLADLRIVEPGSVQHGANGAGPAPVTGMTPAPSGGPMPPAAMDPWARALQREVWQRDVREAAEKFREQRKLGDRASAVERMRAELLDTLGIKARPRLQPIIPGLFYRNSLARIIGSSGHGKSFLVLDLAAHIGAGIPWAGRPVVKGSVLWLVAEGDEGVGRRIEAWETLHGRPVENVTYLPRAVNALGPEWDIFCEVLAERHDDMIVLDTQARITPGADEIDRAEQSMLVEACDRLRVATGACVALVHHRGAKGTHARGHTEVFGALQTQVYVEKSGHHITVGAKMANGGKTKDDIEPEDIGFVLRSIEIPGTPNEFGIIEPGAKGAALEWVGDAAMAESEETKLSTGERRARALWSVIVEHFNPGDGGERAAIKAMFFDVPEIAKLRPDTRRQAWQRSWNTLIGLGLIAKHYKGARFKIVEVPDQAVGGVLTANSDAGAGGVGQLNANWELWTNDLESKADK